MKKRLPILAGAAFVMSFYGLTQGNAGNEPRPPASFAIANVRFEQNATDKDVEVVFEAKGGAEGFSKFTVVAPDGRTIIDFTAPGENKLGIRQFRFESPEPKDVNSLKAAYPEGVYTFSGTTASGLKLSSKSTLTHTLPTPTSFIQPQAEAEEVATENVTITWKPVKNVTAYLVYIEQEEMGLNVSAKLPGTASSFDVPDGFLLPSTEYTLGIGTETKEGNASYIETSFTTEGKE